VENLFDLPGSFLRGNLHTHTTNSDGKLAPQQAVDLYRGAGYDFLALTDHSFLTPTAGLDTDGLIMLPGQELHPAAGELGQTHHIVAMGMEAPIDCPPVRNLQAALDFIRARAPLVIIAHPYWTSLTYLDLLGRTGYCAIEVYNHTCEVGIGRGDSSVQWNDLLARGEGPWGLAVDDAHCHYPDTLGGWTVVKTTDRSPTGIIQAILAGRFYASSGPTIEGVRFGPGDVTVRCSPCRAVHVISPRAGCGASTLSYGPDAGPFTEVTLGCAVEWDPVRIECVDECGRKAWTNPFWRE
jgi:hypothetical protein